MPPVRTRRCGSGVGGLTGRRGCSVVCRGLVDGTDTHPRSNALRSVNVGTQGRRPLGSESAYPHSLVHDALSPIANSPTTPALDACSIDVAICLYSSSSNYSLMMGVLVRLAGSAATPRLSGVSRELAELQRRAGPN